MDLIQHSPVPYSESVSRLTCKSRYIIIGRVGILGELVNFANNSFRYIAGQSLEHLRRA